jgi:hypothetical protein
MTRARSQVQALPEDVQRQLTKRYADLFAVFFKHRDVINRVTFRGVADGDSWLNNCPARKRTSYPLLFDRDGKPEPAFEAVLKKTRIESCQGSPRSPSQPAVVFQQSSRTAGDPYVRLFRLRLGQRSQHLVRFGGSGHVGFVERLPERRARRVRFARVDCTLQRTCSDTPAHRYL